MAGTSSTSPKKYIFDNVFGFIELKPHELKVINHPLFQRLRHIRQLGMSFYVFPGAEHTRFAHSIGTCYLMDRVCNNLFELDKMENKDDIEKLRMAALLHDIGHYPLSHVIEDCMKELLHDEGGHERNSQRLITKTSLSDVLKSIGHDPKEIAAIVTGTHSEALFNQLMHSDLDIDRMDYLTRDSHFTGAKYGIFDYDQLIRCMTVSENGILCIIEDGKAAAENYTLARYLMYRQIYSHHTVCGFDVLAQHCYSKISEGGNPFPSQEDILSSDESKLLEFDDIMFLNAVREARRNSDGILWELCNALLTRNGLKVAMELRDFVAEKVRPEQTRLEELDRRGYSDLPLTEECKQWIFLDDPGVRLSPVKPFLDYASLGKSEEVETMEAIQVLQLDGSIIPLPGDEGSILHQLALPNLVIRRVYTKPGCETMVEDAINARISQH